MRESEKRKKGNGAPLDNEDHKRAKGKCIDGILRKISQNIPYIKCIKLLTIF
jgi:hypothetical protein